MQQPKHTLGGCTITSKTKINGFLKLFLHSRSPFEDIPLEKKNQKTLILAFEANSSALSCQKIRLFSAFYLFVRRSIKQRREKKDAIFSQKNFELTKSWHHTSYSHIRQSLTLEYTKIYAFGLYTTAGTLSRSIVATDRQSSPFFVNVWMALKFSELCKIILTREKFSQDTPNPPAQCWL